MHHGATERIPFTALLYHESTIGEPAVGHAARRPFSQRPKFPQPRRGVVLDQVVCMPTPKIEALPR
jgi:hypothetical protein